MYTYSPLVTNNQDEQQNIFTLLCTILLIILQAELNISQMIRVAG